MPLLNYPYWELDAVLEPRSGISSRKLRKIAGKEKDLYKIYYQGGGYAGRKMVWERQTEEGILEIKKLLLEAGVGEFEWGEVTDAST